MKLLSGLWVSCLAAALLMTGCDRIPGMGPNTLVVDLAVVAKATDQEQRMQDQLRVAREELNGQLADAVKSLEQQLEQERAQVGNSPTPEQEQQLQQLALQAQQRYAQLQTEAQQTVQQTEINLVREFRERVKPFAEKIARTDGATVILLVDQSVFWLDPSIDITDEVIAELRAENVFSANESPVDDSSSIDASRAIGSESAGE